MNKAEQNAQIHSVKIRMAGHMAAIEMLASGCLRVDVCIATQTLHAKSIRFLAKEVDLHLSRLRDNIMATKLEDSNEPTD